MPDLAFLPLSLVSLMSSLGQREARGEDSLGNIAQTVGLLGHKSGQRMVLLCVRVSVGGGRRLVGISVPFLLHSFALFLSILPSRRKDKAK